MVDNRQMFCCFICCFSSGDINVLVRAFTVYVHGRRNRGVWGVNVPLTFGTSGVQGGTGGGPMKMIFASTADCLYYR